MKEKKQVIECSPMDSKPRDEREEVLAEVDDLHRWRTMPATVIGDLTPEDFILLYARLGPGFEQSTMQRMNRVPIDHLFTAPEVFQPRQDDQQRDEKEYFRERLAKRAGGKRHLRFEPIHVWCVAGFRVVIDGHQRLIAFRQAGVTGEVRVRHHDMPYHKAKLFASAANHRLKLNMTDREIEDYAWQVMVERETIWSEEARRSTTQQVIADMTGVSQATISRMEGALRKRVLNGVALEFDVTACRSFREVYWKLSEQQGNAVVDEDAAAAEEVEYFVRTLGRVFGERPTWVPDRFLAAIERRYPEVATYGGFGGGNDDDEDSDF